MSEKPLEVLRLEPQGGSTLEFEYGPICGRQTTPSVAVRRQDGFRAGAFYGGVLVDSDIIRLHEWLGKARALMADSNCGFDSRWWEVLEETPDA